MKIVQVIGGGEKGGSRSHMVTLCRELGRKGHAVRLVCFLDDAVAASVRGSAPVTVFPMRHVLDLGVIRRLRRYLKREKPELVHTHGVRANFIGRLAAGDTAVPVVTTVHSSIYHDYAQSRKRLLYHRIEKWTRAYTTRFIAVSRSLKRELEGDGIPGHRVSVVYNGLPETFAAAGKPAPFLRRELGLPDGVPLLMTVGRMEAVKNQRMLLQVFALLKQHDIPFHGVLVGDGPLRPELAAAAADLGLRERVTFLGFRRDVFDLLSEADLFLLTSNMEGLPVTLLEAMAARTPVVVTGTGGMPEVVELAANGYTVPAGDAAQFAARVRDMLARRDLRAQLAENGYRAWRRHFSVENFSARTLGVYRQVLSAGPVF